MLYITCSRIGLRVVLLVFCIKNSCNKHITVVIKVCNNIVDLGNKLLPTLIDSMGE